MSKTIASSNALAEQNKGKAQTDREKILMFMDQNGWVTAQYMELQGMKEKTFSARISKICDDGLAIMTGEKFSTYFPVKDKSMQEKLSQQRLAQKKANLIKAVKATFSELEIKEIFLGEGK